MFKDTRLNLRPKFRICLLVAMEAVTCWISQFVHFAVEKFKTGTRKTDSKRGSRPDDGVVPERTVDEIIASLKEQASSGV